MTDHDPHHPDEERPFGARYRIDQPDGTWWELGWDRPLGTFYAQHHHPEPYDPYTADFPLAWHGTTLGEHPTVASLTTALPIEVPAQTVAELTADAAAYPHETPPPFLRLVERITAGLPDTTEIRDVEEAVLPGTPKVALTHLDGRVASGLTDDPDGDGHQSLPAAPLARTLVDLHRQSWADTDVPTFAHGLGLDTDLVGGVLAGNVTEVTVDQVAAVCEALHCSPDDLWGPDLASQIAHAYGPERWPEDTEPLSDGRRVPDPDPLGGGRLSLRQVYDEPAHLEVTRYRQTGIIAVDENGTTHRVEQTDCPARPGSEYHFTYEQAGPPEEIWGPLSPGEFADGCPPGHDVDPDLAAKADDLVRTGAPADLIRFQHTYTGTSQWIGRETPFDPWQQWDDPRSHYPGDATDVLVTTIGLHDPQLPLDLPTELTDRTALDEFDPLDVSLDL